MFGGGKTSGAVSAQRVHVPACACTMSKRLMLAMSLSPLQGRAPPSYRVKPMSSWSVEDTIVFFKECVTEKKKVLNNIRSKEVDGDLLRVMEDDELEEHVGLDGLMVKKLRKKMDGASVALSLHLFLCRQLDAPSYASLLIASFGCQAADSCVSGSRVAVTSQRECVHVP